MFALAVGLGVYAYSIFILGILGSLSKEAILIDTTFFVGVGVLFLWRKRKVLVKLPTYRKQLKKYSLFLLILIIFQALVNLVGALGPELSFDALWYHLTLPKLYLLKAAIYYIPGNLLYYSAMPQLTEMYYITALALQGETTAKLIHFLFGILTCIALYLFSLRMMKKQEAALLTVVVFYANLVVGWESVTAFSDLTLTFFTTMSLWAFVVWNFSKKQRWLYVSAILLGFAISSKLLAIGTLGIMLVLVLFALVRSKTSIRSVAKMIGIYTIITLLIASPWLLFAYINTGYPFFPFFSYLNPIQGSYITFHIGNVVSDMWGIFVMSADPIFPIYLMVIPLLFIVRKKMSPAMQLVLIFACLSFFYWLVLPKIGGGRFLLPYLPAYSILVVFVVFSIKEKLVQHFLLGVIILLAVSSIGYRGIANSKYLSVVSGRETKAHFLTKHLHFEFGDFYDVDGYFANHLNKNDTVLLYGFHNLFYVDFPFIDSSWVKKGDRYNYIAVQGGGLPIKLRKARLVYKNPITRVSLYNLGGFRVYE